MKSRSVLLFAAASAALGLGSAAQAATIVYGVNFNGGNGSDGPSVTTAAGVNNISGYNNFTGQAGGPVSVSSGTGIGYSAGPALSLTYSSNNTWSGSTTDDGSNGAMLNGYLDTGGTPDTGVKLSITGLPSNVGGVVTLYTNGDTAGRQGDYTVNGVNQQVYYGTGGSSTLVPDGITPDVAGNYLQFVLGTATSSLTISSDDLSEFRAPINGIDIVLNTAATPEPGTLSLVAVGGCGLLARRRRTV